MGAAHTRDVNQILFDNCTTWTSAADCFGPTAGYQLTTQFDLYGRVGGGQCQ